MSLDRFSREAGYVSEYDNYTVPIHNLDLTPEERKIFLADIEAKSEALRAEIYAEYEKGKTEYD